MARNALAPLTPSPLGPANANVITPSPVTRLRNLKRYDAGTAAYNKENVYANVLDAGTAARNKENVYANVLDAGTAACNKENVYANVLDAGAAACNKENVYVDVLTGVTYRVQNGFFGDEVPTEKRPRRKSEPKDQKIAALEGKVDATPSVPQTPEFSPRELAQNGDASGRSISIYDALYSGSSAAVAVSTHPPSPECALRIFEHVPPVPSSPAQQLPPRHLSFSGSSPMHGPSM